jgi:hypothetical protein
LTGLKRAFAAALGQPKHSCLPVTFLLAADQDPAAHRIFSHKSLPPPAFRHLLRFAGEGIEGAPFCAECDPPHCKKSVFR